MRSIVLASRGGSLAAILLGLPVALPARADGETQAATSGSVPLECRTVLAHAVPSTVCRPLEGSQTPVRVLFRKMPGWAGNSDLLLIDMCKYSPEGFQLTEEQLTVSSDGKLPPDDPRLRPLSCVRRYCTQKYDSFSIALNLLPIPIGWVSVKVWIGFQYQHFQVACESLQEDIS
ncbi:MAG: hypothetical protein IOD12_07315 [Silvanigrellales bacterium]|nr:hypothetical protein [Silvanigrellales bacterium]